MKGSLGLRVSRVEVSKGIRHLIRAADPSDTTDKIGCSDILSIVLWERVC